jgi:hypothetical protein
MNQAPRFRAAPRATSGILGSHTETNRPRHSRIYARATASQGAANGFERSLPTRVAGADGPRGYAEPHRYSH